MPLSLLERILDERKDDWIVIRGRSKRDGRSVAYVGLGRDLCGATIVRLASDLGISITKARRLYACHRAELEEESVYASPIVVLADRGIAQLRKERERKYAVVNQVP